MFISQWWPRLQPRTRDWLIANNGDVVPQVIVAEIVEAGGPAASDRWWVMDDASSGPVMPDEAVDWIEDVANDEARSESSGGPLPG